ncbi:MAG: PfkB family carbohydrate kinase [Chitinophagales bacterium]
MSILVVGSVALDSVETPFGKADDILGGSATYFSTSASFFTDVNLVAVVGDDFPEEHIEFLKTKSIDTKGLVREKGNTFRWKGSYSYDMNEAHTLETHLNVFEKFRPLIPEEYTSSEYVFLANIDPELQLDILDKVRNPRVVALDTMNYWISNKPEAVKRVMERVDIVIINEGEARQLAQETNLIKAAIRILNMGVNTLVIKRGEYGVIMFTHDSMFAAPAFPLTDVKDPTGAGDTFAGGFLGYLANTGNDNEACIRQAIIFGSIMASFNVEDFSLNRMRNLTYKEIETRFKSFKTLTHFDSAIINLTAQAG